MRYMLIICALVALFFIIPGQCAIAWQRQVNEEGLAVLAAQAQCREELLQATGLAGDICTGSAAMLVAWRQHELDRPWYVRYIDQIVIGENGSYATR